MHAVSLRTAIKLSDSRTHHLIVCILFTKCIVLGTIARTKRRKQNCMHVYTHVYMEDINFELSLCTTQLSGYNFVTSMYY